MHITHKIPSAWLVAFSICLIGAGCSLSSSSNGSLPVITVCNLPADQTATISGAWPVTPIPIALQQGAYSASETTSITNAADSWNNFFTASKGFNVINYGGNANSPTQNSDPVAKYQNNLCGNGAIQGKQFVGQIVIFKLAQWPTSYPSNAIALTNFCTQAAAPYPKIFEAVMFLNYQTFFIQGAKQPDLQSVVTHELGHLLGLNHSCETSKANFPNCGSSGIDPDYLKAVMFPSFSFDPSGTGEVRSTLNPNDEGRANCLY